MDRLNEASQYLKEQGMLAGQYVKSRAGAMEKIMDAVLSQLH